MDFSASMPKCGYMHIISAQGSEKNMNRCYRRDGTAYPDVLTWAKEFETMDRKVKQTVLKNGKFVSTVFLGLNHNFGTGKPLIFETMVFRSKGDFRNLDMERYSTEKEAKIGHKIMVKKWEKLPKKKKS